jgi:Ni/Fe-hydrogenase subunit HybB-like protein
MQLDITYIAPILVCILVVYAQLLLEKRLLMRKPHDDTDPTATSHNFKTEKLAYLITVTLLSVVFFTSYSNETFHPAWAIAKHRPQSHSNVYIAFFVIKALEAGTALLLYAADDMQTYSTKAIDQASRLVSDWSSPRYLLFSALDTFISLWLIINFLFIDAK